MASKRASTGKRLRARRLQMGLSLRDVQRASSQLARKLHNSRFAIPASRLHYFETRNTTPSAYRFYSLAQIYHQHIAELLSWYGIPYS